jgi:hypothetical protein
MALLKKYDTFTKIVVISRPVYIVLTFKHVMTVFLLSEFHCDTREITYVDDFNLYPALPCLSSDGLRSEGDKKY